jgi:hypothetical protein
MPVLDDLYTPRPSSGGLSGDRSALFSLFYNMDQRYQAVSISLSAFRCLDREARAGLVF